MRINRPIATVILLTILAVLGLVYSLITIRQVRAVSSDQLISRAREMDAETEVIRAKIIAVNEDTITRLKKERAILNKPTHGKRSKRPKRQKRHKR
tara:strand:+ start:1955 stop:2242 length:288 start_codon:yes stop_codon:yes gene_type:complete